MFEDQKEKNLATEWDQGDSKRVMTIEEISHLAIHGFGSCKQPCNSRNSVGSERCACIRQVFPTPKHYELYLEARAKYLDLLELGLIAKSVSKETLREKENG